VEFGNAELAAQRYGLHLQENFAAPRRMGGTGLEPVTSTV
jgi:hypothetical protein